MPFSQSGGGGSSSGALLFDSTLGADTASIDTGAGGISAAWNVLDVYIIARTDEAIVFSSINLTLNNDTGANYDRVFVSTTNATVTGNNAVAQTAWNITSSGASQAAGVYATHILTIPAYAQTTAQKSAQITSACVGTAAANTAITAYGLNYRSTAAISRMKLANGGGTVLKAGTRLTIFGR